MAIEKLILFHIDEQTFGINVEFVRAIESATDVVRVPNAPSNIEGIISLRGEVIPVYSLHRKFNLREGQVSTGTQLIIVKSNDCEFAFVVDAVDEIHIMQDGEFLTPPGVLQTQETSYMEGIAKVNEKLVLCIDVNALMSEAEVQRVQGFVDQMTASK